MYCFATTALLLSAAAGSLAAPTRSNSVLHEKRDASSAWQKRSRVHGDVKLPMRIGLTQSNLDNGHDLLMDVSHPESANFGKHLSVQEVNDLFAPSEDAVNIVRAWLESAGIHASRVSQSVNKQWLQFDAKTSEAEELLNTKYHLYDHDVIDSAGIACDEYHVPAHIQQHIDYITPGLKEMRVSKAKASELTKRTTITNGAGGRSIIPPLLLPMPDDLPPLGLLGSSNCDVAITPDCIMTMYNISRGTTAQAGNQLGIFEDLGDYYSQTDLNEFFLTFAQYIPYGTHPKLDGIDGGMAPTNVANAGPESDLDFQISYPLIWPQNSILYQTDDSVYEANYTYEG
jgi:tripeptidyl-peptidase-1